jgi:hypothetical protein
MGNLAKSLQTYTPATGTVKMVLDVELAKERKALLTQISQLNGDADELRRELGQRPVTPKLKKVNDHIAEVEKQIEDLEEREREHLHTLHMTKLPGIEWNDLSDKFPPRLEVQLDLDLGYNHHATSLAAARKNTVDVKEALAPGADRDPESTYVDIDGVTHRAEPLDGEDWDFIEQIASGWDIANVVNVQLNLNVMQASNRLGRLKKD